MKKRLVDYVQKIEAGSEEILSCESSSKNTTDGTGSNINTTTVIYKFKDGVSIEYEREHDDGSPYPGCQTFFYTYRVINTNNFIFDGETTEVFSSKSEFCTWLDKANNSQTI
ncbi:MAG: hypothetical protein HEQ35_27805 [Gloeotrichia echinulata IR180]|jgi:hypothetical protein|nr:hypothetical protein [Gloeotrichia echinulata DEX184]